MDRNHAERIKYRSSIIQKHTSNVVNVQDDERIAPAVREYYIYIMGTYLPLRFPTMFKLHETDYETGKTYMLENKLTGALRPAFPISAGMSTKMLLESLGRTIDEDILFLLPEKTDLSETDSEKPSEGKYVLQAFCVCCPSGFNTREKLGLRLASIHDPVPGYKEKLEGSMDRFFSNLEAGKYVKRANWSITTHGELYAAPEAGMGTHAHEGDVVEAMPEIDGDKVSDGIISSLFLGTWSMSMFVFRLGLAPTGFFPLDCSQYSNPKPATSDKCVSEPGHLMLPFTVRCPHSLARLTLLHPVQTFLRVERQTLHRLPTSGAIVFAFKTYLYPLSAIKSEGHTEASGDVSSAEALAQAIDGLREGNVQGMWFYKRGAVWGEAVKKYLRS